MSMRGYYGWVIVGMGMLVLTMVVGAAMHGFGLYVLPVSNEFGLSRAEMNTGLILLNFGMAICGPFLGRLIDRSSIRLVMGLSALSFGASLVGLGLSHELWISAVLLAGPLAVGVVGCGTLTSTALVARWFTAQCGRAMAITAIGISLGPMIVVPLIGHLISAIGWRQTLILLGVVITIVLFALLALVRERPGPTDVEPAAGAAAVNQPAAATGVLFGVGDILRMPQFWTLSLSAALAFGIQQTIIVSRPGLHYHPGREFAFGVRRRGDPRQARACLAR
jgi:MFS family permease